MPAGVDAGTVRLRVAAFAVKPRSAAVLNEPVIPAGAVIDSVTVSKWVGVRARVTATARVPPASPIASAAPAARLKSPAGPMRDTSSRRSWVTSRSVEVNQFELPRYWSAVRTWAGVVHG